MFYLKKYYLFQKQGGEISSAKKIMTKTIYEKN